MSAATALPFTALLLLLLLLLFTVGQRVYTSYIYIYNEYE